MDDPTIGRYIDCPECGMQVVIVYSWLHREIRTTMHFSHGQIKTLEEYKEVKHEHPHSTVLASGRKADRIAKRQNWAAQYG